MTMRKLFIPIVALAGADVRRTRRCMIANAPYESTMGLVQKIFYFHVPRVDR